VDEKTNSGNRSGPIAVDSAELNQLVDQVERAHRLIESLTNRTNTLVRLLDTLNKRVDRLEARDGT
jgi:ABC-type transporter Mla subunit MlaD